MESEPPADFVGIRIGQRRQQPPLGVPRLGHAGPGRRATQPVGAVLDPRIGPRLQRCEAVEHLAVRIVRSPLVADSPLDPRMREGRLLPLACGWRGWQASTWNFSCTA